MNQFLLPFPEDDPEPPVITAAFSNEMIRASAGTGKTFQLSNRFIALADSCDRLDDILAATFARKAAGEILDRVVLRLAEAAANSEKRKELAGFLADHTSPGEFNAERCLGLLSKLIRNIHRLRIGTLDSFFVQIAGSFGLELGLPPGWGIVDDVTDQRLRSLAIQDVLAEDHVADVLTLLHLLNKGEISRTVSEQIRTIANSLYTVYRETTPPNYTGEIPATWRAMTRFKQLDETEWEQAVESLEAVAFPEGKRWQNAKDRDLDAARNADWNRLISGGMVKAILQGGGLYFKKPIPPEVRAVYAPIIEHLKAQVVNRYADQTEATWKLLHRFHQSYHQFKTDQRAYRFEDMTLMLAQAIEDMNAGQLAFRLDSDVGHLLLDEFQDTSLLQWTVMRPFAMTSASRPESSFFCVGDVKQAIYGWRGGIADLFGTLDQELPNLTTRELTKSFRSSQAVIDVVNRVFETIDRNTVALKLGQAAKTWKEQFQTHTTARDLPGYCVLQTAEAADEDDEKQQAVTLKFAAAEVARLHRETPGASIGILVRRNQSVARLIFELRTEHNIEASEEGGNPLLDSAGVQLILSLLTVADHPGDKIARFHVAHSELGPLLKFEDYQDDIAARRLSRDIRHQLLNDGYGATLYEWVCLLMPFVTERESNRMMQLVGLAYRHQSQATERTEAFIEMVSATKVEDPSANTVRVMNIHQSKGLQFDIVVLPELDAALSGAPPSVVVGRKSPTAPVDSVFRYLPDAVRPLLPERFEDMHTVQKDVRDNESLCVLYVAMTRAIHALHMIIAPSSESEKQLPKSYAGLLRASFLANENPLPAKQIVFEHGKRDWGVNLPHLIKPQDIDQKETELSIQLRPSPEIPRRRLSWETPSDLQGGRERDVKEALRENSIPNRMRGLLWHAWLEKIAWLDEGPNSIPDDAELEHAAGPYLHPRINLAREMEHFRQALKQPNTARIFSRRELASGAAELQLWTEFPIASRHGDVMMSGVIDRLVLFGPQDAPTAAEVIDFKTDQVSPNDSAKIEQLGEYYRPQLAAYRRSIAETFGLSGHVIRCRLLFLQADATWELRGSSTQTL